MLSVKFSLNKARMAPVIEKRIMSSFERKAGNRNTQGRETEKQRKYKVEGFNTCKFVLV